MRMRLRHAAVVTAAALPLLLTAPTPASAATGDFLYKVGVPPTGVTTGLADPQSRVCIDLPDIGNLPAFAPENFTTSTATVFLDDHCDGDIYHVMNPGKKLGNRLKFRSVIFS